MNPGTATACALFLRVRFGLPFPFREAEVHEVMNTILRH